MVGVDQEGKDWVAVDLAEVGWVAAGWAVADWEGEDSEGEDSAEGDVGEGVREEVTAAADLEAAAEERKGSLNFSICPHVHTKKYLANMRLQVTSLLLEHSCSIWTSSSKDKSPNGDFRAPGLLAVG